MNYISIRMEGKISFDFDNFCSEVMMFFLLSIVLKIDLMEISQISEYNKGYNYILVAIDCFSRKVWARLLMTKTADEVLSNFQSILNETGSVESIGSDRGKEFVNKKMKKFLFWQ